MPVSATPQSPAAPPRARFLITLLLLWLAGCALRLTILAVPPVIPLIHDQLRLNATQVGILTGLPSMLFAFAAVPGSLLIARLGVRTALVIGLALTAIGGRAARGHPRRGVALRDDHRHGGRRRRHAGDHAASGAHLVSGAHRLCHRGLYQRLADRRNLAGLLDADFGITADRRKLAVGLRRLERAGRHHRRSGVGAGAKTVSAPASAPRRRWWPDWNDPLIWRLGIMLGTINATYFSTNAFLPDYLRSNGQSEWISAALTGLNIGQLPASFLLLAVAGRLERKAWPYVICGLLCVLAAGGIVFGSGVWIVAAATLQGFAAAAILILILALPPLLSAPDDVHRVTAAMFTISYSCAVIVPVISGMVWDLSGIASLAFAPIAICGIILVVLAPAINHVRSARS